MDILKIPFVKTVGIGQSTDESKLELAFNPSVENHLQTIHASAQFTLAETASGKALQALFPNFEGEIIPLLRESKIKFRKPATSTITAYTTIAEEALDKFNEQFSKKGRASILVEVQIKDAAELVTCTASFNWFIQRIST